MVKLNKIKDKYFAGIYQQLWNYLKTLFQCVKHIDNQTFLRYEDKYSYMKMLRCQMTNKEEVFFFYNSLCDLGLEWDYKYMKDPNRCWITKYNLIKNMGLCRFEWVMEVIPSVNIIDHIDKIIHISISSSSSFG